MMTFSQYVEALDNRGGDTTGSGGPAMFRGPVNPAKAVSPFPPGPLGRDGKKMSYKFRRSPSGIVGGKMKKKMKKK
tara:strand:- start:2664 stop:2891 length:228 start_codon:yes stop_codon:yes gene_type:complete